MPSMATFSTLATALELMSVDTLVAGVRYAAAHQHVLCRLISSSDCFDHDMPPPKKVTQKSEKVKPSMCAS